MIAREISVDDLARRLARGERPLLLDVRQPWENELARLPDSQLLPLNELPSRAAEVRPSPSRSRRTRACCA